MTTMSTHETPDTELLRQVHAGRADAFTALYRRHQGPLYRYALMRCGSGDTAALELRFEDGSVRKIVARFVTAIDDDA